MSCPKVSSDYPADAKVQWLQVYKVLLYHMPEDGLAFAQERVQLHSERR